MYSNGRNFSPHLFFSSSFACSLLRQEMKQIIISSETPEAKALEKGEDKAAASSVCPYFLCSYFFFLACLVF